MRVVTLALLLAFPATPQAQDSATLGADRITATAMRADLEYLTSPELGGRGTPSPGQQAAARFLVERLERAGLTPAGENGAWFQNISVRVSRLIPEQSTADFGAAQFRFGRDFVVAAPTAADATGGLVYAGDGWLVKGHDAYKGLDVRGRFVLVTLGKEPSTDLMTGAYMRDWAKPRDYAALRGALGVIFIDPRTGVDGFRAGAARNALAPLVEQTGVNADISAVPQLYATPAMLDALFTNEKATAQQLLDAAAEGKHLPAFPLDPGKMLHLKVGVRQTTETTSNVIAELRGSDETLAREYVALGAHYDTFLADPATGEYRPGADDNGSGTTALLAIAEALAQAPRSPRSIVFFFHTAEEMRLWGSQYFVDHPTIPLDRIVLYLNLDEIGRTATGPQQMPYVITGPNEVKVSGVRARNPTAWDILERLNQSYLNLSFLSSAGPIRGMSDDASFSGKGIPTIAFSTGGNRDAHSAADTAGKIDYEKLEKIARTVYAATRAIASTKTTAP